MPIVRGVVYRVGQIGSFLKIPLGYSSLYGIVTESGVSAVPASVLQASALQSTPVDASQWLRIVLVGEQVSGRFERGVRQSPTTGDQVHLVTNDDLRVVYGGYDERTSVVVGYQSASEGLEARIELDKLVSRHSAVLGATGSGKSNGVCVLLRAIADMGLESARVLVIDPHGEYAASLGDRCTVFRPRSSGTSGEAELSVPFWALPLKELLSVFPGRLSDQNEDYIRGKVLEMKRKSAASLGGLRDQAITADSPIPFSIKRLWFELDDFERMTLGGPNRTTPEALIKTGDIEALTSNQYPSAGLGTAAPFLNTRAKGILSYLDGMRSRLLDSSYSFLFDSAAYSPDKDGNTPEDLPALFAAWFGHGRPISVLDLSSVPATTMQVVAGSILKLVYDVLYWGQGTPVGGRQQPLMVVLDEAHAYLRAGDDTISSRTVQAIAREGRKYGAGLMLVTQRPSELDETVLSQCGTIIALRVSNARDKAHVASAVQDELRDLADVLSSLRTGEAIISGEAVKIPSRIRFFQVNAASVSSDPRASTMWKRPRPDAKEYEASVRKWRNQALH